MDDDAVTSLYTRSLAPIKTAFGEYVLPASGERAVTDSIKWITIAASEST